MASDEQDWRKLIEEYKASGLTQRQFTEQRGVDFGKFQYQLYKTQQAKKAKPVRMVPVRLATAAREEPGPSALIEVELNSGVIIRFPQETDCLYVAELVTTLSV
jgi:hypothetical protein